ncbi:hypothetical protein G4Y79_20910 [Phototrophicus methaneseepsis]|uniref:Uncharacterized protein n=1 Tax=Phototrophicus methaneseepsis TaxID=2710758 RepID=A0A7S8E8B2_9CHLR|nr:hypothetical protein [Phototrophicus methaneseepsis]QPC82118.1 hypothetical protein G4Y79_20910 [Phototrophicus methaneseepsis]
MTYRFRLAIHFGGGYPPFIPDYDEVTDYVKSWSWSIGMGTPYQTYADDSQATFIVNNEDGRFSPENLYGAYAGDLIPQLYVGIYATKGTTTSQIWLGYLDYVEPIAGTYGSNEAMLHCVGIDQILKEKDVRIPLMQNVRAGFIISTILGQIQPPGLGYLGWHLGVAGEGELGIHTTLLDTNFSFYTPQPGQVVFPFVGDNWEDGVSAARAIADVVSAERGRFFINRYGLAEFWARTYLQMRVTVAAEYTELDYKDIVYSYGDDIVNEVTVTCYPRQITASDVILWELAEETTLRPGAEKTISARYSEQDSDTKVSALTLTRPSIAAGTLVYAFKNGSGGLTTADINDGYLTMIIEEEARGAKLRLTNTHSQELVLQTLVLRGRKITAYNKVEVVEVDGLSRSRYGTQALDLNLRLLASESDARDIGIYERVRRSKPRGMVKALALSNHPNLDDEKVERGMGTRIRVIDEKTQHTGDYFIIGEQHRIGRDGQHEVTWTLEPASSSTAWLLGVTGYSHLGINTFLGF